jgi:hypothetical protein
MEERLRFVARLLDGEAMTEVCREFGISRKTVGYRVAVEDLYRQARELGSPSTTKTSKKLNWTTRPWY